MIKVTPENQEKLKHLRLPSLIILIAVVLGVTIYLSIKDVGQQPLCHKNSCMNLDAREKKCDPDVKTIREEKFKETKLQLRYSAKCDAAWSKGVVPPNSILYVEDDKGKKYGYYKLEDGKPALVPNDGIPSPHYGNMGPGKKLKACVQLPDNKHLCTKLAE
jgi:hypothetical protein